jgi:RNA polymerase sigma factor (sigma-70 family)
MDKQIWQNILQGDHLAYKQLYYEYFKKFYNYGKKFTTDTALIEDSIQEVFLEIWNKKEKMMQIESPNSYFFSAFRFILLEKIQQSKRSIQANYSEEDIGFSPELQIIARETDRQLQQKLAEALVSLTPRQREAIFLRFYEGLSYEEVANVLNITVKATYKIMGRSLTSLKDHIGSSLMAASLLVQLCRGYILP